MAHLTNFSFKFFYEIFTEDASLRLLYHGAKKSKMTKNSNQGGSCRWVPHDGYIRHQNDHLSGRMTDISVMGEWQVAGVGGDSATLECFGRGYRGTIFVRSSKLGTFCIPFDGIFWTECWRLGASSENWFRNGRSNGRSKRNLSEIPSIIFGKFTAWYSGR